MRHRKTLNPEGGGHEAQEAEPQGEWTRGGMPERMLGLEGGGLGASTGNKRRERVLARMLGSEGSGL